ncbi:MAG: TIM barrel protein [Chloroflexota bacterium]
MARPRPKILLKARPLPAQLADRLAPPVPDGIELYIHENDVAGDAWFEPLAAHFAALDTPPGFSWIVEGPVWSLDGKLFGLCRNGEVDRELTRRLVRLAAHLGAPAVNVHCVDGSPDASVLSEARRCDSLERALPFLEWYVRLSLDAGIAPLIENVPPICRMRRSAFIFTPIGVEPRDLLACTRAVPGLGLTLDTSHAQLAVNAFRGVAVERDDLAAPAAYYRGVAGPKTLGEFVEPLLPWITSVHVSNAAGLLDEGLPYDQGDADLDAAVRRLSTAARYFVTEPLDPDEDHAVLKREMQTRLATLLGAAR